MLKLRLQGTKEDISWFEELMKAHEEIHVLEYSKAFANKGTNRYFRVYAEIEKEENHGGKAYE